MNKLHRLIAVFLALFFCWFSCKKKESVPVTASFTYVLPDTGRTVPVSITFTNTSTGASSFKWTFSGGAPATFAGANPGAVTFDAAGTHTVTLVASSDFQLVTKTVVIQLDSSFSADFDTSLIDNNLPPAIFHFINRSNGASSYQWTFEGGTPDTSSLQAPPDVTFLAQGQHNVTLKVGNGSTYTSITKTITVGPALIPTFSITPAFADCGQAPMTATLVNNTPGGTYWSWSASSGVISDTNAMNPTIYWAAPGTYAVTLVAGNGKIKQMVQQSITVLPNTNLQTIRNVNLGVLSQIATNGCYYSTRLGRTFNSGDVLDTMGRWIDIAYFGLNSTFSFNKFISPDSVTAYALPAIPSAQSVTFINSLEQCSCGISFTTTDFDNMTSDAPLQAITITPSVGGWQGFTDSMVNRVILFQTSDARKGAIRVNQYVQSGAGNYINIDIKVQKNL